MRHLKFLLKNPPSKKSHIDEIWSIDLADLVDNKFSNNTGFRYIFVTIHNLSKDNWCKLLNNMDTQSVADEFSNIPNTSKRKSTKKESDREKDFYNSVSRNF